VIDGDTARLLSEFGVNNTTYGSLKFRADLKDVAQYIVWIICFQCIYAPQECAYFLVCEEKYGTVS
jgi:uncharacterized membrane protein YjgN (DUF898 family)